jgi:bifunctional oligoribonuclease and PAP phosphatase NrnA
MQSINQKEFEALHGALLKASHWLLATHENPDADAIGSVYALAHIAVHLGKKATIFLPDGVPDELAFLPGNAPILSVAENLPGDLLIATDYGDFSRTGLGEYVKVHPMRIVSIDHHPMRDHRGEVVIANPNYSSASELVYRFCVFAGIPINREIATCLAAGIVFDTGGLQHSSTTSETLEAISDLIKHGVRMHKIYQVLHSSQERGVMKVIADALAGIKFDEDIGMSYVVMHYEDILRAGEDADLAIVAHLLSTGAEQKFCAVFRETEPEKFRVSLRSENFRGFDVSAIAKQFGGGGHKFASGCQIEGDFNSIYERVKNAAKLGLLPQNAARQVISAKTGAGVV